MEYSDCELSELSQYLSDNQECPYQKSLVQHINFGKFGATFANLCPNQEKHTVFSAYGFTLE